MEVSHRWLVMELGDKRFLTRNPRVGLPGVYKTVKLYAGFCVYVYMCVHSCVCVCACNYFGENCILAFLKEVCEPNIERIARNYYLQGLFRNQIPGFWNFATSLWAS